MLQYLVNSVANNDEGSETTGNKAYHLAIIKSLNGSCILYNI